MLDLAPPLHAHPALLGSPPISKSAAQTRQKHLHLEIHTCQSLREVLQLKLQQRQSREELVQQGIMPPLKSPAAFHEQRRSLERAKTEDYLKRKIRSRPERSELVRMHILQGTSAEASLQAKQLMLKRARLADDLNDKLSQRPGAMELVHKNILPIHTHIQLHKTEAEHSSCDEDSSESLSPEQPVNQNSLPDSVPAASSPDTPANNSSLPQAQPPPQPVPTSSTPQQKSTNGVAAAQKPTSGQVKGGKVVPERSRKQRDSKPKVRKLKYHQYIPPDQKVEKETPPLLDSTYASLLHQQQLFLQLQIISQQQHSNYPAILPAPPRPPADQQASSTTGSSSGRNPSTSTSTSGTNRQSLAAEILVNLPPPPPLPPNLEEMKVAELKQELKLRALTVSGTKNDLIERLRTFHEQNGGGISSTMPAGSGGQMTASAIMSQLPQQQPTSVPAPSHNPTSTTIFHQSGNAGVMMTTFPIVSSLEGGGGQPIVQCQSVQFVSSRSPSPPASPALSEHTLTGTSPGEPSCNGDVLGEMVTSPLTQLSLHPSPTQPSSPTLPVNPDKDRMLQEKDRRIAELTRMLQQKQQLVETLRSQLQDRQLGDEHYIPNPLIQVKEEPQDTFMEDVEETRSEGTWGHCGLEQQVLRQNQINLNKQSQNRRKKMHRPVQVIARQQQVPQVPTNQQSVPLDALKSNSSQTLVTDSNGNHFLLTLTNHNDENLGTDNLQSKAASPVTLQRRPSPTSSHSTPHTTDREVHPKPQMICKQPIKKVLKPEKPSPTNRVKSRAASFSVLTNQESFYTVVDPASADEPASSCRGQTEALCLGVEQQPLFSAPINLNSTPTSRRKKNTRKKQLDNFFDTLVRKGEISENFRPTPDPALSNLCPNTPPLTPSLSPLHLSPPSSPPSFTYTPPQPVQDETQKQPQNVSTASGRLEDFLESATRKPLLGAEPDASVALIDELHGQLLNTSSILDHPPSPMDIYEMGLSSSRTGLELAESAMDSMDWLDLGMGVTAGDGTTVAVPNGHVPTSVFSTDFLDNTDIQLHWDACF